jgi:hypothetical protein
MSGLQTGSDLVMRNAELANVWLDSAHVGGQLDLSYSKVSDVSDGPRFLELTSARVGQLNLRYSKVAGTILCFGLDVEQNAFMEAANFDDEIHCVIAKIKGGLYLELAQIQKSINLSGVEVGGALSLDSARWSHDSTLILRNAKVGIIALSDAWAPKLDLDGLTYQSAGAANQFQDWFGRLDHYAPQPYDQLAAVVQGQGNSRLATAIRYSGRELTLE